MKLERHQTKIFFTDRSTKINYCVNFMDFEKPSDGYSVLLLRYIDRGKWQVFKSLETKEPPTDETAEKLLKKYINL